VIARLLRVLGVRSDLHFDGSVRREMERLPELPAIKPPRVRYQGDPERHRITLRSLAQWRKKWAA
jgi:hypothetical protein